MSKKNQFRPSIDVRAIGKSVAGCVECRDTVEDNERETMNAVAADPRVACYVTRFLYSEMAPHKLK